MILWGKSATEYYKANRSRFIAAKFVSVQESHAYNAPLHLDEYTLCKKPIEIQAQSNTKHNSSKFTVRYISIDKKFKCYWAPSQNILLPCPELVIVELSRDGNFFELFQTAMEFCGTYTSASIDNNYKIQPITSFEKIEAFCKILSKKTKICNKKLIMDCCKYGRNFSASPMETNLLMKLCLPVWYGGAGLKNLRQNVRISLSAKGKRLTRKNYVVADYCFPERRLIIEYDSKEFHSDSDKSSEDKSRRDALVLDGWQVFTYSANEVQNLSVFNEKTFAIMKCIGHRFRANRENFYIKQSNLFQFLSTRSN